MGDVTGTKIKQDYILNKVFERSIGTIDPSMNARVPFFRAIDSVLMKYGVTNVAQHVDIPFDHGLSVSEYPAKVFVLPNLTVVYERSRICNTRPEDIKSDGDDSYTNTVHLSLFSVDSSLLEKILTDLESLKPKH